MLERLRLWLAGLLAPDLVRQAAESADDDESRRASMPAFVPSEESPLGLKAFERARSRELEDIAAKLADMDPLSRDRIIAYARPKRVGRRAIITAHEAQMERWYADHPNA